MRSGNQCSVLTKVTFAATSLPISCGRTERASPTSFVQPRGGGRLESATMSGHRSPEARSSSK